MSAINRGLSHHSIFASRMSRRMLPVRMKKPHGRNILFHAVRPFIIRLRNAGSYRLPVLNY